MNKTGKMRRHELRWAASACALVLMMGCSQQPAAAVAASAQEATSSAASPPAAQQSPASVSAPDKDKLPAGLSALVPGDSKLLASAVSDLDGDGVSDAVLILRNQAGVAGVAGVNPCELVVAHGENGAFTVQARSRSIVECTYNQVAARAATLQDNLKVSAGAIGYTNQLEKGTSTYSFGYDKARKAWHLTDAVNAYPQYNTQEDRTDVVREEVHSPKDVPWISLESFDPDALYEAFKKNKTIME